MWTYNDIRTFVTEQSGNQKQIIARLNPLNNLTVLHNFGYESPIVKVTAYVVGQTDLNALRALTRTGLAYNLVSPWSTVPYYLNSIDWKLQHTTCQTLRPDLATDSPVYIVEMELYHDG